MYVAGEYRIECYWDNYGVPITAFIVTYSKVPFVTWLTGVGFSAENELQS